MFSLDYAAFDSVTKFSYNNLLTRLLGFPGATVHRKKKCYFMYGYLLQGIGTYVEVETNESTLSLQGIFPSSMCCAFIVPTLRRILMVRFRIPYCSQVRGTLF